MGQSVGASTLVIIHSSVRAGHYTAPALRSVGLAHNPADFAYCGAAVDPDNNPYHPKPDFDWGVDEPADIGEVIRSTLPTPLWDYLVNPDNPRGLAATPKTQQLWLSGLIQWHYKKLALDQVQKRGLVDRYSWVVFIRSDYLFTTPLPSLNQIHPPHALVLDGDNYGGVNDRLFAFPTHHFDTVHALVDFDRLSQPDTLEDLAKFMGRHRDKNPERLLKFQLDRVGLTEQTDVLPQLGFCVRPHDESSRWSMGVYSPSRKVFIKYPTELTLAKLTTTPLIRHDKKTRGPRRRPLAAREPRHISVVKTIGHHRTTLLAPTLLVLGEARVAMVLWRKAWGKTVRKLFRKLSPH